MGLDTKWENGIVAIPLAAEFTASLDKAGEDGWEPWGIMGADDTTVRIAVKREKRLISVVPSLSTIVGS